jgi:transcription elongation factor GreB
MGVTDINETPRHITPAGAKKLREELNYLWKTKRPDVTARVSAAAALGDRSENADYIYGKKQLREIDRRIRYLTRTLDNIQVVDRTPDATDTVYFGAWVQLEDPDQAQLVYRIVGADEFDLDKGWISINSPMAKSLLKKREGDVVTVSRPAGEIEMKILKVSYSAIEL